MIEAVAFARAYGNDFGELVLLGHRLDQREEHIFGDEVDLGEDEEDGAVEFADEAEEKFVFAGPGGTFAFRDFGVRTDASTRSSTSSPAARWVCACL